MKKYLLIAFFPLLLFCQQKILIPMDLKQTNHLKAYGIAFWVLEKGIDVDWLRGSLQTILLQVCVNARLMPVDALLCDPQAIVVPLGVAFELKRALLRQCCELPFLVFHHSDELCCCKYIGNGVCVVSLIWEKDVWFTNVGKQRVLPVVIRSHR